MSNVSDILGRPFTPPEPKRPEPPDAQLRQAISDAGMTPPDHIRIDGHLHRFSPTGQPKDDAGWYVAFPGSVPGGQFGDWRTGISIPWRADIGRDLTTAEEMAMTRQAADARRMREAEQAKKRETAADTAASIWGAATLASDDHPYLTAKGITAAGLRVTGDGRLIAPLYIDGDLTSLQFISQDGEKRYLAGGKTGGACWQYSPDAGTGPVYVAEGVATAASIYEATGQPVIVAYSAGNLTAAAQQARKMAGMREVVIVADNDASGTGEREANRAAQASSARVIVSPEGDANDYAQAGGDLHAILCPPPQSDGGYLIQADQFADHQAPVRWIIKRWLQRDALHMIHGPSGGGKTFVVLDMILTSAAGLCEWMGNPVKPASVVYLAGEGHSGLRGRIAGWKLANEVDSLNAWVSRSGDDLDQPEGLRRVYEAISALPHRPDIIVVDTLHRFMAGDENSAQDARAMLESCATLQRDFQSSVILVHHTGVSDEAQHRARGSSAWRGALDIEISIVPKTDERPIEIVQRKSKDAELPPPIWAELAQITLPWLDEDGEQVTTAHLKPEDAPVKTTESKATAAARKRLEDAIIHAGGMLPDGGFYISSRDWQQAYLDGIGQPEGKKPTREAGTRMCQRDKKNLVIAGVVEERGDMYVLSPLLNGHVAGDILTIIMKTNKNKSL